MYIIYMYTVYINILLNTSYAPQIPWFISQHIPSKCPPLKGSETKTGDLSSQARAYANCGKWQAEKSYSMAAGAKWFFKVIWVIFPDTMRNGESVHGRCLTFLGHHANPSVWRIHRSWTERSCANIATILSTDPEDHHNRGSFLQRFLKSCGAQGIFYQGLRGYSWDGYASAFKPEPKS